MLPFYVALYDSDDLGLSSMRWRMGRFTAGIEQYARTLRLTASGGTLPPRPGTERCVRRARWPGSVPTAGEG